MPPSTLIVFARPPVLGRVKSRLARAVGPEAALEIYRTMLATLLERLEARPASIDLEIWSADSSGIESLQSLVGPRGPMKVQGPGDLGQRMAHAVESSFGAGSRRVTIVGSDSPDLPLAAVEAAYRELESHDMVLGPTDDGGYYLVGFSRPVPGIFEGIPWSSGQELEATRAAASRLGLRLAETAPWYDIDHIEDLERFAALHAKGLDPSFERMRALARRHLPQVWAAES